MPYVLLWNGHLYLWLTGSHQRKVTEDTAYFLECFSVCSSDSAAGSTLKEPGSSRVLSLLQCPEAGTFEGRSHKRQGQVSRHWGRPRKQQKGCMFCIYIKLCICWKQCSCLFSCPVFSLLIFQLYLLVLICFPIFDESCSSSKASLAPSFHVHSSHIPQLSRKSFLLLHTPACSSFLVSNLLVLA